MTDPIKIVGAGAAESVHPIENIDAMISKHAVLDEMMRAHGKYHFQCFDSEGNLKWEDDIDNVVTTVGKNLMLDTLLAGSSYSVTGPYLGLISNVSWSAVAATDTMASHAGWTEAGGTNAPTYTGNRKTAPFSSASGGTKAMSSNQSYSITSGTNVIIKGAFLVLGTGAVNTKDDTNGVLYSAGAFSGGDKTVSNGDTLTVSYQTSLT